MGFPSSYSASSSGLQTFREVFRCSCDVSRQLLLQYDGNLEMAIDAWYSGEDAHCICGRGEMPADEQVLPSSANRSSSLVGEPERAGSVSPDLVQHIEMFKANIEPKAMEALQE